MPQPNAKAVKAMFEDALKTYEEVGPEFAVRHVIERDGFTAEDIALAWLVPEALDAKSQMTKSEKATFDAEMKARDVARKEEKKAAKAEGREVDTTVSGDVDPHDIDSASSTTERAAASGKTTTAGPAGGDLNPHDGGEKKPPVGGDVAKAPKK